MRYDINVVEQVFFLFSLISIHQSPCVPSSQVKHCLCHAFLFKNEVGVRQNIRKISYGGVEGPFPFESNADYIALLLRDCSPLRRYGGDG